MSEYIEHANEFCRKYGVTIDWEYQGKDINDDCDDGKYRNKWKFTICRGGKKYSGMFWDSVNNTQKGCPQPSAYDLLACLEKYDPYTFKDFCDEFGYDSDSRRSKRTYKEVCREYAGCKCSLAMMRRCGKSLQRFNKKRGEQRKWQTTYSKQPQQ